MTQVQLGLFSAVQKKNSNNVELLLFVARHWADRALSMACSGRGVMHRHTTGGLLWAIRVGLIKMFYRFSKK
jgi:hypothetical protein